MRHSFHRADDRPPIVLLGVTGSIAAYKAAEIARALIRGGVRVRVVMTPAAERFVTPLTFEALTGSPAITERSASGPEISHIAAAREAAALLIAPATAHTIAKIALGLADNLLSEIALATTAPVFVAPAMNVEMYGHPATQANVATLRARGVTVFDPVAGELACGESGVGRLADPERIAQGVLRTVLKAGDLEGESFLVTAGPTREPIDPVRFISNRSSGRMGYAVAAAALARGARVRLVTGPVSLPAPPGAEVTRVETGSEMAEAVDRAIPASTVLVMAAAVSDWRPESPAGRKIKKGPGAPRIDLVQNPDILEKACRNKGGRIVVGFAAETDDLLAHAREKLARKGVDLLVANDVSSPDSGFDVETNRAVFFMADGAEESLPLMTKDRLADLILDHVRAIRLEGETRSVGARDRFENQ
ncbi:MAG: hypothetical protein A2V83_09045 [Nitrospirae bacterium RBG_16_64_22]|nr:MAG: hypothetical protein A2V83_09045 [Nitrospirae bacterium RBG_16_64_22]